MGTWMKRWLGVGVCAAALCMAPRAEAHRKRTDPCGCHHEFGMRHCHAKAKTDKCEAAVSGKASAADIEQSVAKKKTSASPKSTQTESTAL